MAAGMPLPLTSPMTMSAPSLVWEDLEEVAADLAGRLVDTFEGETRVGRGFIGDEAVTGCLF